jgi:hypothetical protein
MSSFSLFAVGYVILIMGLAYGAYLLDVPREWIIVGFLVLAGLGVMKGVSKTKPRDPVER